MKQSKRSLGIVVVLLALFLLLLWTRSNRDQREQLLPELLVIGTAANFPPFEFHQDGDIVGFDIDLAKELVKRLGKRMIIKDLPFEALIPQLNQGSIHLAIADIAITPEREKRVALSSPYMGANPLMIVTREGHSISMAEDLVDATVLVVSGHTPATYLASFSDIRLQPIMTLDGAFRLFEGGSADALATEAHSLQPYAERIREKGYVVTPLTHTEEQAAIAVSPQNPLWLKDINTVLESMRNDGTIDQLRERWHIK